MDAMTPFCTVCQKHFSGWKPYEEHMDSPAHKRSVHNMQQVGILSKSLMDSPSPNIDEVKLDEFMTTQDKNLYFCMLCKVPCSGKIPALNHCLGKSHRKQKQRHQFSMSTAGPTVKSGDHISQGVTDLSDIPVSSGDGILNSTATSETVSDFSVFETNPLTGHFLCKVCNLSVSGVVPAEQHVKGKAHIKKAKRKSVLGKLFNENSGNSYDLAAQFSHLDVSDSGKVDRKFPEKENVSNDEKESNLEEKPSSPSQNGLDVNVSGTHGEQTDVTSKDGRTEVKGQRVEDGFEVDEVTGHWKCKLCQVSLTGEEPRKQHLAGKAHQKKVKAAIREEFPPWSSLISDDFSLPSREVSHDRKKVRPQEIPAVVEESSSHSKIGVASEPFKYQGTNFAGPQVSPYLVHQLAMTGNYGGPYYQTSHTAKDALAIGNIEMAKQLLSFSPHGVPMVSPYVQKEVRSNPPLSDFLKHQSNAALKGDMGNFWSLEPNISCSSNSNSQQADGGSTVSTANTIDPIGTQPHVTKLGEEGVTSKEQINDQIKECFSTEANGKLLCKVCAISVCGSEPAWQHLQGKSHIKKQRAFEFNQKHMPPYTPSPATSQGYEDHHQMGHHMPSGSGVDLHQERFPSNCTLTSRQQGVGSNINPQSMQQAATSSITQQSRQQATTSNTNLHSRQQCTTSNTSPQSRQQGGTSNTNPHSRQQGATSDTNPHSRQQGATSNTSPQSRQQGGTSNTNPQSGHRGATSNITQQSRQQDMKSPPAQHNIQPYGGNMEMRHHVNPYHTESHPPQLQQQEDGRRDTQSNQHDIKPFSVGQFVSNRVQDYPCKISAPTQQIETPLSVYQERVPQNVHLLDNYSFSSSSSHHSSGQYSDEWPHSLRGVSLPEYFH